MKKKEGEVIETIIKNEAEKKVYGGKQDGMV